MAMLLLIISFVTLIITYFIFANSISNWFKPEIPVDLGFWVDEKLKKRIIVSSGDPEKRLVLRFINKRSNTISNVVIDIKFIRPLALSGTNTALTVVEGHTNRTRSDKYYNLTYLNIPFYPNEKRDFPTEINTDKKFGKHKVLVSIFSTNDKYKVKKKVLRINIR